MEAFLATVCVLMGYSFTIAKVLIEAFLTSVRVWMETFSLQNSTTYYYILSNCLRQLRHRALGQPFQPPPAD